MFSKGFFLAVGNRCAVDFASLELKITDQEALIILTSQGYKPVTVQLTEMARNLMGKSRYQRNCQPFQAPEIVDCSSFIKWLYAQKGIWLPRHPIDQRDCGYTSILRTGKLAEGDLLFSTGRKTMYWDDPATGVGHVGMVTSDGTVIHAANSDKHIVEEPLETILENWKDRGSIRVFRNPERTVTLQCPPEIPVECSTAFRWKIFAALSSR